MWWGRVGPSSDGRHPITDDEWASEHGLMDFVPFLAAFQAVSSVLQRTVMDKEGWWESEVMVKGGSMGKGRQRSPE